VREPDLGSAAYAALDRLVTTEIRRSGQPRGFIPSLYDECRGHAPISQEIALRLGAPDGGRVALVTGVRDPAALPHGETDGPLGAVALGRALRLLGFRTSLIVPDGVQEAVVRVAEAAAAPELADDLRRLEELSDVEAEVTELSAGVFVEVLGANSAGSHHTVTGNPYENPSAPIADALAEALRAHGRLTIAFGDGGNELGFGAIAERARALVPHGHRCRCPCGAGIVSTTETTLVFPVAVSNWGCYAACAALALLHRQPELVHTADAEGEMLDAAAAAGCRDGVSLRPVPCQDGVDRAPAQALVRLIETIVYSDFERFEREF
jgi:hypothetical protein